MTKTEMNSSAMAVTASDYNRAFRVLRKLRDYHKSRLITSQEAKSIKGQALAGDIEGAERGLTRLVTKRL